MCHKTKPNQTKLNQNWCQCIFFQDSSDNAKTNVSVSWENQFIRVFVKVYYKGNIFFQKTLS